MVMEADTTSREFARKVHKKSRKLELRQGKVETTGTTGGRNWVKLYDSTAQIICIKSYTTPAVNDIVWYLKQGSDSLCIGEI